MCLLTGMGELFRAEARFVIGFRSSSCFVRSE